MLDTTRGKVVYGGKVDVKDLWIEPTIVVDVLADDPLMKVDMCVDKFNFSTKVLL